MEQQIRPKGEDKGGSEPVSKSTGYLLVGLCAAMVGVNIYFMFGPRWSWANGLAAIFCALTTGYTYRIVSRWD